MPGPHGSAQEVFVEGGKGGKVKVFLLLSVQKLSALNHSVGDGNHLRHCH